MTPPPPPLGRPWHRGATTFDPALDDAPLVTARDALAQGRWTHAREMLADTGDDWDRRGHRLIVLGEGPASGHWAREWLLAEPDSADAAALLACAAVFRAIRGKERSAVARAACLAAARMVPADPTPWLCLLVLARRIGTNSECVQAFDQVRGRHRDHHHAHHLMAASLADRPGEASGDPLHEVYDFAEWAAEQAPADSPLAVLPVIAHCERYRALVERSTEPARIVGYAHWNSRRARQVLKAAFDWWLKWEGHDHPRRQIDLNFLAYAKVHEGRTAEAAALFHRIGPYATRVPWSYPDRDPRKAFNAARSSALGAG